MTNRLEKRIEARKLEYERRKKAHEEALEARKAVYEKRKQTAIGIGIRGIGISPTTKRALVRYRAVAPEKVEVIKPEVEERPHLVDVIDENEHLRIALQLSDISLPHDITIDEITDVSFKHGVLEIRLRKRKRKLTEKEEEELEKVEKEEFTAEIKKKVLLMLKKRKEAEKEKFMI
jgi:hypothetical protein